MIEMRETKTLHGRKRSMKARIATGFDFEPLPNGNVLVEFFGDDGETFNTQVVTADVVASMPVVAYLAGLALTHEIDAIKAIIAWIGGRQEVQDGR
jgi:hypothetical protein